MWTAWDYIGETGAGAWAYTEDAKAFAKPYPWLLGGAGALDLLGDPTGEAYHARAIWSHNKVPAISVQPMIHEQEKLIKSPWRGTNSIPSWSFQNCEGREATVEVYADADVVELFVNQKSIGVETITDCKAEFRVCYEPGVLEAVTYDKTGKQLASGKLLSASGEHKIQIQQEEQYSGGNIVYLNINICGENGIVESNADEELTVKVTGGELLGFGSANPRTEENFTRGIYTTFYGRAQAVVRVTGARAAVSVKGRSLKEQTLYLNNELS